MLLPLAHFFTHSFVGRVQLCDSSAVEMSFPQLGYPQYLSASQAVYGSERPGVLTPSSRGGSTEIGGSPSATAAAVTSVLGMYANPYAHNYSAFLPYTSADLALFSQMVRIIVWLCFIFLFFNFMFHRGGPLRIVYDRWPHHCLLKQLKQSRIISINTMS